MRPPGAIRSIDLSYGPKSPGAFPHTRGIDPLGYRERSWVMGMYSGYGSAEETNRRLRELIARGQSGFSIALDLPPQNGLDCDLLDGISLDRVRQISWRARGYRPAS